MMDSSGKVLSGLTPASEKRSSKRGGYASVFFQLFDWNRRLNRKRILPHKLLPAVDRPGKHGVRNHKDDKLPMAKLLLIANENRGGFPRVSTSDAQEVLNKEKTPEKKKSKRSPSVVAKLMGLETMPSPEPCKDSRKQADENQTHEAGETGSFCDAKPDSTSQTSAMVKLHDASDMKPPRALVCYKSDDPKISFFCKLPALSPRKAESALRSILSPSKTHNKLLSPIKSPLSTKRGARLLEAAAKILEPNMQPSARLRGLGINSQAGARTLLGSNASLEGQKPANSASRPPKKKPPMPISSKQQQQQQQLNVSLRVYSDQCKAQGKLKTSKRASNMQDINSTCKSQAPLNSKRGPYVPLNQESLRRSGSTKEESASHVALSAGQPRLMRSKSVREEPEHGKSNIGYLNELRNVKEEKGKPELTRQKHNSNRLNQPRAGAKKKELGPSTIDENAHDAENLNPNIPTLVVNKGEDSNNVSTDTVVTSSSIINYGRLFSSRKLNASHDSTRKTQKKGDSSVMKSLLRKKGSTTDNLTKSSTSKSAKMDNSQGTTVCKGDESEITSLEVHTGNQSSSLSSESFIQVSLDDNSSEVESALASSLSVYVSEVSMKSKIALSEPTAKTNEAVISLIKSNTLVDSDVATLGQSELSSAEDLHDSASSSYALLELPTHRRKKAVSYSGKSTAAILQELLMALNSTETKTALENRIQNMTDSIACESSSKFTLYPQLGEDCEDSASSALNVNNYSKKTPLASTRYGPCIDEWKQPSPISILEFPCIDEAAICSNGIEDAHERKLLSQLGSSNLHEIFSKRHHASSPAGVAQLKTHKKPSECEEQYVKDIVKTAKLYPADIYAGKLQLPCAVLDPDVFNHLEEQFYQQWEWGIRPDESIYLKCRSETDMRYTRSLYVEAGMQNRKLVFECAIEALNMQLGINEHHSRQSPLPSVCASSEGHISKSVSRHIEMWRGMACCMNIDDIVEQEMSTGFGKWTDFVDEVSDFAVELECNLLQRFIDELVIDMSRSLPTLLGNGNQCIW